MPGWLAAFISSLLIGFGFYGVAVLFDADFPRIEFGALPSVSQKEKELTKVGTAPKKFPDRLGGFP